MKNYEKLKGIIDEIDDLLQHHAVASSPAFEAWHVKTERFLIKEYGEKSLEYKKFRNTIFSFMGWVDDEQENVRNAIRACADSLRSCKAVFETYLEEMLEEDKLGVTDVPKIPTPKYDKIFIVHGHDEALKQSVARLIEKQDIEAIILSEKANQGKTIIEKIEAYSNVNSAICLFTADDLGRAKAEEDCSFRARQNVVFEAGYFIGKLGRNNVILISNGEIELPSDLQGVVYTNEKNWEIDLVKELKAMGYSIDMNKMI